jgi:hypothetical protein
MHGRKRRFRLGAGAVSRMIEPIELIWIIILVFYIWVRREAEI